MAKVLCKGHDKDTKHELEAAELAGILEVIQEGDAQTVTPEGVRTPCLLMILPTVTGV